MVVMNVSAYAADTDTVTVDLTSLYDSGNDIEISGAASGFSSIAASTEVGSSGSLTVSSTENGLLASSEGFVVTYNSNVGGSNTSRDTVDGDTVRRVLYITTTQSGTITVVTRVGGTKAVCLYDADSLTSVASYSNSTSDTIEGYSLTTSTDVDASTYCFGGIGTDTYAYSVSFTPASTDPSVTLTIDNDNIAVGGTATVTAKTANVDSTATVALTSSDDSIATVDEDGTVTGVAAGTATITATMTYNETTYTATVDVTVYAVTIDDADALTAVAPSYSGDYTTITTNADGSVTYSYDFAALAADAIANNYNSSTDITDEEGNDTIKNGNYNFTLSNGTISAGDSTKTGLDGDKFYNLSTSDGNLQVVKDSTTEAVKFASDTASLNFAVGNDCITSVAITAASGSGIVTNSDSGDIVTDLTALETGNYSITRSSSSFLISKLEVTVTSTVDLEYVYFGVSQDDADNYSSFYIVDGEGNKIEGSEGDTVYSGVSVNGTETAVGDLTLQGTSGSDYVVGYVVKVTTGNDTADLDIAFE